MASLNPIQDFWFNVGYIDPNEFPTAQVMTVEEYDREFLKSLGVKIDE